MSFSPRRLLPPAASPVSPAVSPLVPLSVAAAVFVTVAGCTSGGDGPRPPVPSPTGPAAAACRALHGALPERVGGQPRAEPESGAPYAAVWGDPAIELGCGVPRPGVLTPGSEQYNPTPDLAEVNGVPWLLEEQEGGYRFTTVERTVFVRVTVPDAYAPEINALVDLADAVRGAIPAEKPRDGGGTG
ncbi:hypothetical protein GCM10010420_25470 [Streptomyces glaucosporus]|uniref:DUF3515 domain-containing protein n=1 Tax=Streptomyces glaucosporus TaxID=284044 RepID=A0ABP5VAV9_9ACTN